MSQPQHLWLNRGRESLSIDLSQGAVPAHFRTGPDGCGLTPVMADAYISRTAGRMAEWLCNGLQIRVQRFDSASGLQWDDVSP